MKKEFFKSRKFYAIIIMSVIVIVEIISSVLFHINKALSNTFVDILYYISQIVSSLFVTGGVLVAVWQYYLSCKSARTEVEIEQVQRAIDLSEYYKDNILTYLPAISYVFEKSGAKKILDAIHPEDMKRFDIEELNSIFTKAQRDELQNIQASEKFYNVILEANSIYNLHLNIRGAEEKCIVDGRKQSMLRIDGNSVSVAFMSNLINRVLNNMEFFALHFKHNTADETVVYQSLHQTYIRFMPYLYYYIAKTNTNASDKLYTNVIWLYHRWNNKKKDNAEVHARNCDSMIHDGTIIKNYS